MSVTPETLGPLDSSVDKRFPAAHSSAQSRIKLIEASIFALLLICFLASLVWSVIATRRYLESNRIRDNESFELATVTATQLASRMNGELNVLQSLANNIVQDWADGQVEQSALVNRLQADLQRFPQIHSAGIAFEPRQYLSRIELYAPYFLKDEAGLFKQHQLEDLYDYTDPERPQNEWYHETLSRISGYWPKPYFNALHSEWVVEYRTPLIRRTESATKAVGVFYINYTIDTLVDFLHSIDAGEEGFSYLLDTDGDYIYHPSTEFIRHNIFTKANELQDSDLNAIGEKALTGEAFFENNVDPATHQVVWTFHKPLPLADWSLGIVFDKSIGQERPNIFVRNLLWLMLSIGLTILLLAALILRVHRHTVFSLWGISIAFTTLCVIMMGTIWFLENQYPPRDPKQIVLANPNVLEEELKEIDETFAHNKLAPPIRIPTGVMLETIGVTGFANENVVTGTIWQKYPLDFPSDTKKGFVLTDVVDDLAGEVEERYHVIEDDHEIIGWFFRAALRQEPSVDKFPLDEATIQIQIWPKALDDRIVLVPDLESYEFVTPSQTPGVPAVPVMVLENWNIRRSYFSYRYDDYNANFGSRTAIVRNFIPDLYFNVIVGRQLLSPIVAYAVTILVIAGLMFAVLVVEVDGAFGVLGYAASLFFVVAISQVGLRGELEAAGVVYLEYGYIVLYVIILGVAVNSIFYHSGAKSFVVQYKSNLIPKLFYWPVVSGSLLLITLLFFIPPVEDARGESIDATPLAIGPDSTTSNVVETGEQIPPTVAQPCDDDCPFAGQTVTVLVNDRGPTGGISGPLYELKKEFEAATGAQLEIVGAPRDAHLSMFIEDHTSQTGKYDISIASAEWIGELVSQDYLMPYDDLYGKERFPSWDLEDVQTGPRTLLRYNDAHYMVANDHDGHVLYYRRDLFEHKHHQVEFEKQYGHPLAVPETWDHFHDIAEYFDGKDLNGDGKPDHSLSLHLKNDGRGVKHYLSFSASFVIGPENPNLYWFDLRNMAALVDNPGHVRALETLVELAHFSSPDMFERTLGDSWDQFLRGEAAMALSWGDLGALAQQPGSQVRGQTGAAQLPGTHAYYEISDQTWIETNEANRVGNTIGSSWAGVISAYSDAPEAAYYLLALMAHPDKALAYASRGWDGIDPG